MIYDSISPVLDQYETIENALKDETYEAYSKRMFKIFDSELFKFSTQKTLAEISSVNQLFKENLPYNEFKKGVKALDIEFNKNYLRTEYDTFNSVILNSDEYMSKSKRYKYAIWKQIQRATKRPDHADLHNKTFLVESLPAIPPIGWNCGCVLKYTNDAPENIMTPEEFKKTESYKTDNKQGLMNNPVLSGKLYDNRKIYGEFRKVPTKKEKGLKPISNWLETAPQYSPQSIASVDYLKENYDEVFLTFNKNQITANYIKYYQKDGLIAPVILADTFGVDVLESQSIIQKSIKETENIRNKGILVNKKD